MTLNEVLRKNDPLLALRFAKSIVTCQNCAFFEPNTVAEEVGWCNHDQCARMSNFYCSDGINNNNT